MKVAIDAIYENGTFRPIQNSALNLSNGQQVRITVEDAIEPEVLRLAAQVYQGLTEEEIEKIEQVSFKRGEFFRSESSN
jgi:predicted DNA-binding antitoxin AbrB/MazE fold protein